MKVVLAALSACVLVATVLASGIGAQEGPGAQAETAEIRFFELLNESRAETGLAPMVVHYGLSRVAREWSASLSSAGALSHNPNLFDDVVSVIPKDVRSVAENVGQGANVDDLHKAFLASPSHRQALMGGYRVVGIGVVVAMERIWVTFDFADVVPDVTGGPNPAAPDSGIARSPAPEAASGSSTPTPGASDIDPRTPPVDEVKTSEDVAPVITPSPVAESPLGDEKMRAGTTLPSPMPGPAPTPSSVNPMELPGMEALLALGPGPLDALTSAVANEPGDDRVAARATLVPSRPDSPSPVGRSDDEALLAAAPGEATSESGVLRILTLAVLGLAAAVATSIALKPRRRTARGRSRARSGVTKIRQAKSEPPVLPVTTPTSAPATTPATPLIEAPITTPAAPSVMAPEATPDFATPSNGIRQRPAGDERYEATMSAHRSASPGPSRREEPATPVSPEKALDQPAGRTNERKENAQDKDERPARTVSEVAEELGVDDATLREWVRAQKTNNRTVVPPVPVATQGPPTDPQLREEVERLRMRIVELEADRDLLKRTTVFWVNESNG